MFDPDHSTTLYWAAGLTLALVLIGEPQQARALGQDTLERCRRVFGIDHLITMLAGAASALTELRELEPARALGQDTLQRCRRTLGLDHPTTLLVEQMTGMSLPVSPRERRH